MRPRSKAIWNVAICYLLLSALGAVFSPQSMFVAPLSSGGANTTGGVNPVTEKLLEHGTGGGYFLLRLAPGPIGFLFNLGDLSEEELMMRLLLYAGASFLLLLCLLIAVRRSMITRVIGYVGIAAIWLGSSALLFWQQVPRV